MKLTKGLFLVLLGFSICGPFEPVRAEVGRSEVSANREGFEKLNLTSEQKTRLRGFVRQERELAERNGTQGGPGVMRERLARLNRMSSEGASSAEMDREINQIGELFKQRARRAEGLREILTPEQMRTARANRERLANQDQNNAQHRRRAAAAADSQGDNLQRRRAAAAANDQNGNLTQRRRANAAGEVGRPARPAQQRPAQRQSQRQGGAGRR